MMTALAPVPPIYTADGKLIGFVRPSVARCPGCHRDTDRPTSCDRRFCTMRHLGRRHAEAGNP